MAAPPAGERLVDVVIPTYNNRDGLLECLAHLNDPVIAELIVVDDVSSDGTPEAVKNAFPDVRVVEIREHRGISHAINIGVAVGEARYVLLLNDDVLADDGSVNGLLGAVREHPEASSAAGRLVDAATGETQGPYRPRHFPTAATLAARLTGFERVHPRNRWSGQHLRAALPDRGTVTTSQQPAGACFLFPRDLFEATGGFDEDYWFAYEDTDFARRLSRHGPLVWAGDATFRHVGMRSLRRWRRDQWHERLHYGTLLYAQRHFSRLHASLVAVIVVAASLLRLAWVTARRAPGGATYRRLIRQGIAVLEGKSIRLQIPVAEARRRVTRTETRVDESS